MATPSKNLLLFDDQCGMCAAQMRWLARLDWFQTIRMMPISDHETAQVAPQISMDNLQEAIHCVTPGGHVYRGASAIRHVGRKVPLLAPLAVLMWIPGVMFLADRVYGLIARNRYVISRVFRCGDSCAVPSKCSAGACQNAQHDSEAASGQSEVHQHTAGGP